jgi:hypothetical protein
MTRISDSFDLDTVEWRRVTDPETKEYKVDFEFSLLGYDVPSGRLDMLLRYAKGRGHCRRHRHVASTMTLVLEGEQHLNEMQADGTSKYIFRKKGDYALANPDALPHTESGGDDGGTVLLSMYAPDGILFEYFDENMENGWTLSIEDYVTSWKEGGVYGAVPGSFASKLA